MFSIKGNVDSRELRNALESIITDHDILRVAFVGNNVDRFPLQIIKEKAMVNFHCIDLSKEGEDAVAARLHEEFTETPVYDHELPGIFLKHLKQDQERSYVILFLPAIVGDLFSSSIILKYLFAKLWRHNSDHSVALQYAQFAQWQNDLLSDANEEGIVFWNAYDFSGFGNSCIPFGDAEQPRQGNKVRVASAVDHKVAARLRDLGSVLKIPESSILLACWKLLLYNHSHQESIVVGYVSDGREYDELKSLVGPVARVIPVTTIVNAESTFEQFAELVYRNLEEVLGWQEYFSLEKNNSSTSVPSPGIFGSGFEYVDTAEFSILDADCRVALSDFITGCGEFKFKLLISRNGDDMVCTLEADVAITDPEAKKVCEQFIALLSNAIEDPTKPLAEIATNSFKARKEILEGIAPGPERPVALTVTEMLRRAVEKNADRDALVYNGVATSYTQLQQRIHKVAGFLRETLDIKPDDLIGVTTRRSDLTVINIFAILDSGAAFVPIDTDLPAERLRLLTTQLSLKAVLTDQDPSLLSAVSQIPIFNINALLSGSQPDDTRSAPALSDLAYLLFTSGSTGVPKAVQIEHRSLSNYVQWANTYYFNDKQGYDSALFTPITFDLTLTTLFCTLLRGDRLLVVDATTPEAALRNVFDPSFGARAVKLTPAHILLLSQLSVTAQIDVAIVGGEALKISHVEQLRALNPATVVFNEYGPTETTVGCSVEEIERPVNKITVGTPIDNTTIYILKDNLELCSLGEIGEICVAGYGVSRGYKHDAGENKFVPNPYHAHHKSLYRTGDLGRWLSNGRIDYLGRKDRQLKIRGFRIDPIEIEEKLLSLPGISAAHVLGASEENDGHRLVAYYSSDKLLTVDHLKQHLAASLPNYAIPEFFIAVEKLPINKNGKVDVKSLPDIRSISSNSEAALVAPRTAIEKKLAGIWQDALKINPIGVDQDFFKIGGNSLNAFRIIARISKELKVSLEIRHLLESFTIERLARYIQNSAAAEFTEIVPLPVRDHYEVSHAQRRLWVSYKTENPVLYNMEKAMVIHQSLNRHAFERAILEMVNRHESLRTVFIDADGDVRQRVLPLNTFALPYSYRDFRNSPDKDQQINHAVNEMSGKAFQLDTGPLFRTMLLQKEDNEYVFMLAIHHIICDGLSLKILRRELFQLYDAFRQEKLSPLQPLTVQYKDFSAWQNAQLTSEKISNLRNYWLDRIDEKKLAFSLPVDFTPGNTKAFDGDFVRLRMSSADVAAMKTICSERRITTFPFMLSLFGALLYRLTGHKNILLMSGVSGRTHEALTDVLGVFVNTIPIPMTLDPEEHFSSLLMRNHLAFTESFAYHLYPFDLLARDLKNNYNVSNSLLNIGFTWDPEIDVSADDVHLGSYQIDFNTAKSNLWLYGRETGQSVEIHFAFNTNVFRKETIVLFTERFSKIVRAVLDNIDIPIQAIQITEEPSISEETDLHSFFQTQF